MQLDPEALTLVSVASGFVFSIVGAGISYGVMNEKVRKLEQDIEELNDDREKFVTFKHFEDVIQPVRRGLDTLQSDVKQLLTILAHGARGG